MNIDSFTAFVQARKHVKKCSTQEVPQELLLKLLECARWAPTDFNLQPVHYVVVTDKEKKEKILQTCMQRQQMADAPALVVFTGDRRVVQNNLDDVIDQDSVSRGVSCEEEEQLRRHVEFYFGTGALGIMWFAKALSPLLRLFTAWPYLPAVHKRYWLTKQVMLGVMNFMLAAEAAGLVCLPIEGFDEWRVKCRLGIPLAHIVPKIIAVGYPVDQEIDLQTRMPLTQKVHWNDWND